MDSGADPRAARDLALLLWRKLGCQDRAPDVCVLGLANDPLPAEPGQSGPPEDELRVVQVELATLYLRLTPRAGRWQALADVESPAVAPAFRLLVTGFAHGLAYHPVGLYDLAGLHSRTRGERDGRSSDPDRRDP